MDVTVIDPPRRFSVGTTGQITINECARVMLENGEAVAIVGSDGGVRWPVVRRSWGFSLPLALDRRSKEGLLAVLSGKDAKQCHLLLYRDKQAEAFRRYERQEQHRRFGDLAS